MSIVSEEWSVVILGAWNRAILTPSGISKRLFGLPKGTAVEVMVPLDVLAPFKVRHSDTIVAVASDRLIVNPSKCSYANMQKAMDIAKKSLEDLPETPVSAAGYNFKFKSNRHIPALAEAVDHRLDQTFSDSDYTVLTRAISRSLKWKNGEIRVIVSQEEDNAYSVLMNFHMGSDSTDTLKEWLSVPIADARKHIEKILFQCLGISEGMINHAEEPE